MCVHICVLYHFSPSVYKKDQKDKKQAAATRKQQKVANEEKSAENADVPGDPVEDMECSTDKTVVPPPPVVDGNPTTSSAVEDDLAIAVHEPFMQTDAEPVVLNL